jgi:energy-coupling factor transport system ATP-binding protein
LSGIVVVEGFEYAYPGVSPGEEGPWVLRGVDFAVEEGEFVSIMGPTGVGKTTLCLGLNGIVPQSTGGMIKGDVTVNGLNTKRTLVPELARYVGLVFQEPETQLFNMTVEAEVAFGLESLGFPPKEMGERVEWALSVVGMDGYQKRSPFSLSGGQKQRIAIASILAMMPKILVLDEPTASLDPLGKTEVFSVVRELRRQRGMTIIMVSFESERIAEFSDRVVVLREGQVEMQGTPDRVFAQVELMGEIGLAVPQVSELAYTMNRRYHTTYVFTQLEEAYQKLTNNSGKPWRRDSG